MPGAGVQLLEGVVSLKIKLPMVREPSSVTVASATRLRVPKSAVLPAPLATVLPDQLPGVGQPPPAGLVHVPFCAAAGFASAPNTAAAKSARRRRFKKAFIDANLRSGASERRGTSGEATSPRNHLIG